MEPELSDDTALRRSFHTRRYDLGCPPLLKRSAASNPEKNPAAAVRNSKTIAGISAESHRKRAWTGAVFWATRRTNAKPSTSRSTNFACFMTSLTPSLDDRSRRGLTTVPDARRARDNRLGAMAGSNAFPAPRLYPRRSSLQERTVSDVRFSRRPRARGGLSCPVLPTTKSDIVVRIRLPRLVGAFPSCPPQGHRARLRRLHRGTAAGGFETTDGHEHRGAVFRRPCVDPMIRSIHEVLPLPKTSRAWQNASKGPRRRTRLRDPATPNP